MHEKGLQRQIGVGTFGQHPGTKSGRRPAGKPWAHRLSTARCVPPSVYTGFRLLVLPERRSGKLLSMPWKPWGGNRVGYFLGERTRRRPVLPGLARPRRPAVRPPAPTRPWHGRVLDSRCICWNFRRVVKNSCSGCFGNDTERLCFRQTDLSASRLAPPRAAAHRRGAKNVRLMDSTGTKTNRQQGTKTARGPADEARIKTVVSWANRPVGVWSCLGPHCLSYVL